MVGLFTKDADFIAKTKWSKKHEIKLVNYLKNFKMCQSYSTGRHNVLITEFEAFEEEDYCFHIPIAILFYTIRSKRLL